MKPRGEQETKAETPKPEPMAEAVLSAMAGQSGSILESVLVKMHGAESDKVENPEIVQILDSESNPESDPEKSEKFRTLLEDTPEERPDVASNEVLNPTIDEVAKAIKEDFPVAVLPDGRHVVNPKLGTQSDGTFRMIVAIPEGLIDAIIDQAGYDGVSPEEWVSERVGEYLQQWWSPARSR
jgi:hypothetical protein